jgi:hypothetical protein
LSACKISGFPRTRQTDCQNYFSRSGHQSSLTSIWSWPPYRNIPATPSASNHSGCSRRQSPSLAIRSLTAFAGKGAVAQREMLFCFVLAIRAIASRILMLPEERLRW